MIFEEITLKTDSLEELLRFYESHLKLHPVERGDNFATLRIGSTELRWETTDRWKPFYHFAIDVPPSAFTRIVKDLETRLPLLEEDGQRIHQFLDWNATSVYFLDPSGNIVELIARFNLTPLTKESTFPQCLLRLSEIGFPCTNLEAEVQRLALPVWKDYGVLKAVGYETALMILVPEGRGWKPTRRPAKFFPFRCTMRAENGTRLTFDFPNDSLNATTKMRRRK